MIYFFFERAKPTRQRTLEEKTHYLQGKLEKKIQHLKSTPHQEKFDRFLDSQGPFLTAPGVVAELQRHVQDSKELCADFYVFIRERFRDLKISEELVRVQELREAEVREFGFVDASLIRLLEQHRSEKLTLVTSDQKLRNKCVGMQLPCKHVSELIASPTGSAF